ncbi:MAG: hypothetical protein IPJ77_09965 [Planctomycetes bacterium]|nr:hypothetical protein [Planctomycetota bacterium]
MEAPPEDWTPIPAGDPTKTEVSFPAGAGWQGTLVLDNAGVGVWTVGVMKVFTTFACPEIVGLDDKGRCHLLWSYSGKWSPVTTVADGTWLGGLAQGDVDPRIPGPELYVGAQSGNVYEIVCYADRMADFRRVARLPGSEVHTLIAGEIDPHSPGPELIAFTLPGAVYQLKPKPAEQDGFDVKLLLGIDGRVRDARALPVRPGHAPEFAVVMRTGNLSILSFGEKGPQFEPVIEIGMGMGRLALKGDAPADRPVLYSTADDGRVYRSERGTDGKWKSELVYAGPQGMRGCAWGHFDADPNVETIAVHGYGHRVELLSRRDGKWTRETVFVDKDKGHWLAAGEVDGRNATDELVCSGYSGRVVLLARPPGYGLPGLLTTDRAPAVR